MDDIIKSLNNLVYSIARKFTSDNVMLEDLYQQGVIGIISAFNNFDESLNIKFSTYARMYIYGEIYNYYNCNKNIRLNKNIIKTYLLINKTKEKLYQVINKEPSLKDISLYLSISEEEINYILNVVRDPLSLEYEYDSENMYNFIHEDNVDNLYIDEMLSELNDDQRKVIMYKYFNGYNQTEIAKIMNISQAKVSREERNGINKIRTRYKEVV